VTDMREMFFNAKNFDQDLEAWGPKLHKDVKVLGMFVGSPLEGKEPSWYHERASQETAVIELESKKMKEREEKEIASEASPTKEDILKNILEGKYS